MSRRASRRIRPSRFFLLLQHEEHFFQNKNIHYLQYYNTTYNTLLILHYLVYSTSIDYNFYTTFIQLTSFSGYTHVYLVNWDSQQVST